MQRYGDRTYAQNGEDLILLNLVELLGIPKARYLDLGAYHPETLSNTKLLYDRGHRGVNVEADPKRVVEFILQRPEDINVSSGVGAKAGVLPYYICDEDPARNSFYKEMITNAGFTVLYSADLPLISIHTVLADHCNGEWPEILLIDTEGMDYEILKAARFTPENRPKIIVTEVGFDPIKSADMRALMHDKGYFTFYRAACNMIFVDSREYDKVYT